MTGKKRSNIPEEKRGMSHGNYHETQWGRTGGSMQRLLLAACLLFNLAGCSVFMAAQLPDKKNLEVF
jgi:hypothetical protein